MDTRAAAMPWARRIVIGKMLPSRSVRPKDISATVAGWERLTTIARGVARGVIASITRRSSRRRRALDQAACAVDRPGVQKPASFPARLPSDRRGRGRLHGDRYAARSVRDDASRIRVQHQRQCERRYRRAHLSRAGTALLSRHGHFDGQGRALVLQRG